MKKHVTIYIEEDLYNKVRKSAEDNHRNYSKEICRLLEMGLHYEKLKRPGMNYEQSNGRTITIEELEHLMEKE